MEFLRKTITAAAVLFLLSGVSFGQDNTAILKAFESSYTYEAYGEYNKAIEGLKKVYDEKSYEMNLRLGWLYYLSGAFTDSHTHYQRAMSIMPASEEAKFGDVYPAAALGKWDVVAGLYQKIIEISPNNTTANYKLGMIYYGQGNYQKASERFDVVINMYPFGYDGLIMAAWTNLKMGKIKEAKILFNKVLMLSPNDASALEGLKTIK